MKKKQCLLLASLFCAAKPFSFREPNHLIVLPRSLFSPDGKGVISASAFQQRRRRKVNFLTGEKSARNTAGEQVTHEKLEFEM